MSPARGRACLAAGAVGADTAAGPAVDGVGAAGDRGAAARAQPGRVAVPQRFQPVAEPPDGCLSLAEVGDPPDEVVMTGELGQVGVWPVPVSMPWASTAWSRRWAGLRGRRSAMKRVHPLRHWVRRPRAGRPGRRAVRPTQDEGERVTLLAAERGRLVDQPGDIGIQAGLRARCGAAAAVAGLVVLVWGGRRRAGARRPRRGGLGGRPASHPGLAFFRCGADLLARMI